MQNDIMQRNRIIQIASFVVLANSLAVHGETKAETPTTCTYQTYTWNTRLKKAVNFRTVRHPYSEVSPLEKDRKTGCTVCREDQALIRLLNIKPFYMCRLYADRLRRALLQLMQQGTSIRTLVGYRVGKTRGDADARGLRTRFSNHSFGIAVDINSEQNGLYDRCPQFGPQCRLIRGGPWRLGQPGSLRQDGPVVLKMKQLGFRWGGKIAGKQKDFMHFSPSGY